VLLNLFDHLNICIVVLLLHIYDINRLLCQWPRRAETCSKITACLYIIVSNYNTVVGIYIQGVPGGKDLTSGECSLGQTISI